MTIERPDNEAGEGDGVTAQFSLWLERTKTEFGFMPNLFQAFMGGAVAALSRSHQYAVDALYADEHSRTLEAALRLIEWGGIDHHGDHFCPQCGSYSKDGHRSSCEVGRALAAPAHAPVVDGDGGLGRVVGSERSYANGGNLAAPAVEGEQVCAGCGIVLLATTAVEQWTDSAGRVFHNAPCADAYHAPTPAPVVEGEQERIAAFMARWGPGSEILNARMEKQLRELLVPAPPRNDEERVAKLERALRWIADDQVRYDGEDAGGAYMRVLDYAEEALRD